MNWIEIYDINENKNKCDNTNYVQFTENEVRLFGRWYVMMP